MGGADPIRSGASGDRSGPTVRCRRLWRGQGALVLGVLAATATLASCQSPTPAAPAWDVRPVGRVWPAPPERPRVGFVGEIRSANDLGAAETWTRKLANLIFGREQTGMVKPMAVARGRSGLLAVTDPGVPTVHLFDTDARTYRHASEEVEALLGSPVGVAVDGANHVFVTDSSRARIFELDAEGRLVAEIGVGALVRPTGIAIDASNLFVVDTVACQVVVFDLAGQEQRRFGGCGVEPGRFNAPTFLTILPNGTLAISDSLNFRVQIVSREGVPLAAFGQPGDAAGDLPRPKGIASDAEGRLYVVDAAFDAVQIFEPDGTLLMAFGQAGRGAGEFNLPAGLLVDATRSIWVADSFNQRVQAFRLLPGP